MFYTALILGFQLDQVLLERPHRLPVTFLRKGVAMYLELRASEKSELGLPIASYQVVEDGRSYLIKSRDDLKPFTDITRPDQALQYTRWLTCRWYGSPFDRHRKFEVLTEKNFDNAQDFFPGRLRLSVPKDANGYLGVVSQQQWEGLKGQLPAVRQIHDGRFEVIRMAAVGDGWNHGMYCCVITEHIDRTGDYLLVDAEVMSTPSRLGVRWLP